MPERKVADETLTFDQEMKRLMLHCIDKFYQEIDMRCKYMEYVSGRFEILELTILIKTSETKLIKFVECLVESYYELSAKGNLTEIARLGRCLKAAKVTKEESLGWISLKFLEFFIEYSLF